MKNLNYPLVSVVICTQKRAETLEKYALNSILKLKYPNYEVVVIDDDSKNKTQEILKKFKNKIKNLTIIKNNRARGLCYVRNLGVKYSKGEIIAFTDDDCIVDKNWLKELVKPFLRDPNIMVVGGKILIENSKRVHNNKKQIRGGNMSFRRQIFKKFLFDNSLHFNKCHLHDETELIYRMKNKNIKVAYVDKAIVRHFAQPAIYRKDVKIGSPLSIIYIYTKKTPLIKYYFLLFAALIIRKLDESFLFEENKEIICELNCIKGLLFQENRMFFKLPWIIYVLLIEIPLKAKIKGHLEEIKFKQVLR